MREACRGRDAFVSLMGVTSSFVVLALKRESVGLEGHYGGLKDIPEQTLVSEGVLKRDQIK